MDLLGTLRTLWRAVNDETTAHILEHILADEINHVRFANEWIKRMVKEDRRVLFHVAVAMRSLAETNAALAPETGEVNQAGMDLMEKKHTLIPVNVEDRRMADFSEAEIQEVLRQHGLISIASAGESTS